MGISEGKGARKWGADSRSVYLGIYFPQERPILRLVTASLATNEEEETLRIYFPAKGPNTPATCVDSGMLDP